MTLRVLIPAVVFLSLLMLFGLAGSTFFSFSPVSPVHAQSAAPVFPEADANVNYNRTVDENQGPYEPEENRVLQRVLIGEPVTATGDGITYSLKNARKSLFEIDRTTGQLMVGASLNYEDISSHIVTVVATNASGSDKQEVTINVNNVDEPGKVTLSWYVNGSDQLEFKAEVSDPDGGESGHSWEWARDANYRGSFSDTSNFGASTDPTATHTRDDDHDNGKYLRVTATYTDTLGSGKTAKAPLRRKVEAETDSPTLKFDSDSNQGYNCEGETGTITRFCVNVPLNITPAPQSTTPPALHIVKTPNPTGRRLATLWEALTRANSALIRLIGS